MVRDFKGQLPPPHYEKRVVCRDVYASISVNESMYSEWGAN